MTLPESVFPSPAGRTWFAVLASIVTYAGVSRLLTGAVLLAFNLWTSFVGTGAVFWLANHNGAGSAAWFVAQALLLASAVTEGWVCEWLSPRSSDRAALIVLTLTVLGLVFAPLPDPHGVRALAAWALAAPVGFCIGFALRRRRTRVQSGDAAGNRSTAQP